MGRHPGALERAIEAIWLAAVVVVPLLVNAHSGDPFELQKVAMLRGLALGGAALGATGWLATRRQTAPRTAWAVLALAHLLVLGASTALSVDVRASLFGASYRQQGLVTEAAYVLVFLLLLRWLRTREQLERLVDAALVASLPVALYGVVQRFGADPVPWSSDVTARVTSSLGNPIFLGGFIILVVPWTLYRHVSSAREIAGRETSSLRTVLVGGSVVSLAFQVAAWSFGPVSGTLAALVTLVFWWQEAKLLAAPARTALRLGGYNVLLSAQLAALLLSGSRGPLLGLAAGLGFFALLWCVGSRRLELTLALLGVSAAGALALVLANAPSLSTGAGRDLPLVGRLTQLFDRTGRVRIQIWEAAGRALVEHPDRVFTGFGPETLHLAVVPYFEPEPGGRPRGALPDRAHNDPMQRLLTTGAAGLTVQWLWTTALVALGLGAARALTRETLARFVALWLAGGASGALLARSLDGSWRLSAPAASLGMLAGAGAYVGWIALARRRSAGARSWSARRWLAAASTSALVAHFVELQFGIGVTSTRLYAWVLAACLVAAAAPTRLRPEPRRTGRVLQESLVTLALATLAHDFLAWSPERLGEPSVLWLFGSTWVLGGLLCLPPPSQERLRYSLGRYAVCTIAPLIVFAAFQQAWIREPVDIPEPFWGFVLLWIAAAAITGRPRPSPRLAAIPAYAALAGAVLLAFGPLLDTVRADVSFGQARLARMRGDLETAERSARAALGRRPHRDVYLFELGRIAFERASRAPDGAARFEEAVELFERWRASRPLDPRPTAALAQVYTAWADATEDPARRGALLAQALELSDQAIARFPANPNYWNERAATLVVGDEMENAIEALSRSLQLDDRFMETYLALGEVQREAGSPEDAIATYERGLSKTPGAIEVLRALASVLVETKRTEAAVAVLEKVVALQSDDAAAHLDLALLFNARGDRKRSRFHAELALRHAPPGEREAIASLISAILATSREN